MKYDKLIRDKIPEIIEKNGKSYKIRTASNQEYLHYLLRKVGEESLEVATDPSLEELADLMEVIYAILDAQGFTREELEWVRTEKAKDRGTFSQRLILIESED